VTMSSTKQINWNFSAQIAKLGFEATLQPIAKAG
jgi:hypothetical protein